MQGTPSSAANRQTAMPVTTQSPVTELDAGQAPQHHQSGSGAPPPRPRVDIREDIRASFLMPDDRPSESDFSKKVASLLASTNQAEAQLTRLSIDIDKQYALRRALNLQIVLRPFFTIPTSFELSSEVLASCLVPLEPGTEGTDPASHASTASTATTSDHPGANRDNSAV